MRGGPSIKKIDDVPWEEMSRVRYKDGREASIWEKWIEISPRYVAFYNKWDPGAMTPLHGHHGDHSNLILQGEIRCGNVVCAEGSHIMLEYGDLFGPWVAGPEGCTLYGFIAGEGSPFLGDGSVWQAFLDKMGAEMISLPMPKGIPPWMGDKLRNNPVVTWQD